MKRVFTLIISLIITNTSIFAQAPGIEWQKCYGGSKVDIAKSIRQTNDGGYIVAGYTNSKDGNVTGNHGTDDFWILKLNSSGDIQWQKCYGGSNPEAAYSICQTNDGGYIAAGYTASNDGNVSGRHGEINSKTTDCWVVKLSASGEIQWQKCLGGTQNDAASSICQTSDNGYIIAGYTYSNDGDVNGNHCTSISNLTPDAWIVKLNTKGDLQWQKCLGGTNFETANSIRQANDGGYIVAGHTFSNDSDVSGNHGYDDYWLVKLSSSGNLQWQKCLGGSNYEAAMSAQESVDGSIVIAGSTYSNDGDVIWDDQCYLMDNYTGYAYESNHGSNDFWFIKLKPDGNMQWQRCYGGSGNDEAYSTIQTDDGGYITAGYNSSTDGDVTGNHGSSDFWVVKTNSYGFIQWQKSLGGSNSDYAHSILQTSDGGYIVAGWTSSNDGDVTGYIGGGDLWLVKLNSKTSACSPENENDLSNIMISPNPSSSSITIKFPLLVQGNELSIYDIFGRKVYSSITTTGSEIKIDVTGFAAGYYTAVAGNVKKMFVVSR